MLKEIPTLRDFRVRHIKDHTKFLDIIRAYDLTELCIAGTSDNRLYMLYLQQNATGAIQVGIMHSNSKGEANVEVCSLLTIKRKKITDRYFESIHDVLQRLELHPPQFKQLALRYAPKNLQKNIPPTTTS